MLIACSDARCVVSESSILMTRDLRWVMEVVHWRGRFTGVTPAFGGEGPKYHMGGRV